MKWVLIGHRGVGKSAFLNRLRTYYGDTKILILDLDREIETREKKPVSELFPQIGEARFREMEREIFAEIHRRNDSYILAVGGGFPLETIGSPEINFIWLRRNSDELGRIFTDRPRLNNDVSPLQEFKERYDSRQSRYQAAANEVYWLPEGIEGAQLLERKIWSDSPLAAGGILTLHPWHLKSLRALRYGCDLYEIRDDLLPIDRKTWLKVPRGKRLLSFRDPSHAKGNIKYLSECDVSDWALELGPCPTQAISMVSSHQRMGDESLGEFLARLEASALPHQHLKAAPVIETYAEAEELMVWQSQAPDRRSILPRSASGKNGKWLWLRLFMKGRQNICFWRDSDGSAADQPTLFEWLSTPDRPQAFAALLGAPVMYSRTMIEQHDYFSKLGWPIWPVLLTADEFEQAVRFQMTLGLRAAAVTAPLKQVAYSICDSVTPEARTFKSVNTFYIDEDKAVHGHNTDCLGFEKLLAAATLKFEGALDPRSAVVWGGGGTLAVLQTLLPEAIQISVRTRLPRMPHQRIPEKVHVLVWAAGPADPPPPDFDFDILLDLNYREDSRAREWALVKGRPYLSGLDMFKAQAAGQRAYWTAGIGKRRGRPCG